MQVNLYTNSFNNNRNYNKNICFKGAEDKLITESLETISTKSKKLVQCMNCHIDNVWAEIKSGKLMQKSPIFSAKNSSGDFLYVEPIYGVNHPSLLLESYDGKYTDRIVIDRKHPDNFRFERSVATEHGNAAIKTFDSHTGSDQEIEGIINKKIETFFPLIIPRRLLRENFGSEYRRVLNMPLNVD